MNGNDLCLPAEAPDARSISMSRGPVTVARFFRGSMSNFYAGRESTINDISRSATDVCINLADARSIGSLVAVLYGICVWCGCGCRGILAWWKPTYPG
jgi:hypothetical protein